MKRPFMRAVVAVLAGASAVGGVSAVAWANTETAQACVHYVDPPGSAINVWVRGGRTGCTNNVSLTLELFRGYWGVDGVVRTAHGNGTNFSLLPNRPCAETGRQEYYGKLRSTAGGTWQGPKATRC